MGRSDEQAAPPFSVGDSVVAFGGSEHEARGVVVEDFGEFTPTAVESADGRIADPARRWAVTTDDGRLLFVDTGDLTPQKAAPSSSPSKKKDAK